MIGATLEDLQRRLDHALQTLSNKEGEVIKLKEEFNDLNELCATRQVQIDSLTDNLESAQKIIVRQSNEIEKLKQIKNRIEDKKMKLMSICEAYNGSLPHDESVEYNIIQQLLKGNLTN